MIPDIHGSDEPWGYWHWPDDPEELVALDPGEVEGPPLTDDEAEALVEDA